MLPEFNVKMYFFKKDKKFLKILKKNNKNKIVCAFSEENKMSPSPPTSNEVSSCID